LAAPVGNAPGRRSETGDQKRYQAGPRHDVHLGRLACLAADTPRVPRLPLRGETAACRRLPGGHLRRKSVEDSAPRDHLVGARLGRPGVSFRRWSGRCAGRHDRSSTRRHDGRLHCATCYRRGQPGGRACPCAPGRSDAHGSGRRGLPAVRSSLSHFLGAAARYRRQVDPLGGRRAPSVWFMVFGAYGWSGHSHGCGPFTRCRPGLSQGSALAPGFLLAAVLTHGAEKAWCDRLSTLDGRPVVGFAFRRHTLS
jgi:hypothetical protein